MAPHEHRQGCLTESEKKALASGELEFGPEVDHLERCPSCQASVDSLAESEMRLFYSKLSSDTPAKWFRDAGAATLNEVVKSSGTTDPNGLHHGELHPLLGAINSQLIRIPNDDTLAATPAEAITSSGVPDTHVSDPAEIGTVSGPLTSPPIETPRDSQSSPTRIWAKRSAPEQRIVSIWTPFVAFALPLAGLIISAAAILAPLETHQQQTVRKFADTIGAPKSPELRSRGVMSAATGAEVQCLKSENAPQVSSITTRGACAVGEYLKIQVVSLDKDICNVFAAIEDMASSTRATMHTNLTVHKRATLNGHVQVAKGQVKATIVFSSRALSEDQLADPFTKSVLAAASPGFPIDLVLPDGTDVVQRVIVIDPK